MDVQSFFAFVRELIDIPSITGGEAELGRHLEHALVARGYDVRRQEVTAHRFNLCVLTGARPRVFLCTHLDTVPPFFGSSEDDRHIYGRGACDAKGILAAMVSAAERLREEGLVDYGMLFTVGEELDGAGAKVANRSGLGSMYVIVGEPTGNRLASGHKGTFKFRLRAKGKAAHSAYPELGDSAIDRLLEALAVVRGSDWGTSDVLGRATVNVGTVSGGVAANVVAPEAEAQVYIRVVGKASEVASKLARRLGGNPALSYEVIAEADAVTCETVPGFDVAPVAFGTDIPYLAAFGRPILLGPGSIHDAHTTGEKVSKQELLDAVDLYCRLMRDLLARVER